MKKLLSVLLSALIIIVSAFTIYACGNNDEGDNRDDKIVEIYNTYVAYAEENGKTPLSYEDWLSTIKGEKGETPKLRINEQTNYWEVSYDNGTTWASLGVKATGGSSSSENGTEGLHFRRILAEDEYMLIGIGIASEIDIVIPSVYKGLPVTAIDYEALYHCDYLQSISIPASVTDIGDFAFADCKELTSITFEENSKLENIGESAFSRCAELQTIFIPEKVTNIGHTAFNYCDSLTDISVSENNTEFKSIDGNLYSKDGQIFIKYAPGKTDEVIDIPASVTCIEPSAFFGNGWLTSVAFGTNSQLSRIGGNAFASCAQLQAIEIPASTTCVEEHAFADCSLLTDVYYTGSEQQWQILLNNIEYGNDYLTNATIHYNSYMPN